MNISKQHNTTIAEMQVGEFGETATFVLKNEDVDSKGLTEALTTQYNELKAQGAFDEQACKDIEAEIAEIAECEKALADVKAYLAKHPELKNETIECLKFNIEGLKAEIAEKDFDWLARDFNKDIINDICGDILMDYTIKASAEEIIAIDTYLVENL